MIDEHGTGPLRPKEGISDDLPGQKPKVYVPQHVPQRIAPDPKVRGVVGNPFRRSEVVLTTAATEGEWQCTGIIAKGLRKAGKAHGLGSTARPTQPTTDESGQYMSGKCYDCEGMTIWKKK